MLPPAPWTFERSPLIVSPLGLSGELITGGGSKTLLFRWPQALMIVGVGLVPDTGAHADLARMRLSLTDTQGRLRTLQGEGFRDSVGGAALVGGIGPTAGAGSLGWGRPYACQWLVNAGDIWKMRLDNTGPQALRCELSFHVRRPRQ